jgi:hypothetical protein
MTSSTSVASRVASAGADLVRQVRSALDPSASRPAGTGQPASGWLVVTVLCEASDIDQTALPAPLAELGEQVEVRVRPAADSKGTELAARLNERPTSSTPMRTLSGKDPQSDLRSALRRAKQLLEVGEVLVVDPTPHGKRTPTPTGALLESWTKAAPGAGVR